MRTSKHYLLILLTVIMVFNYVDRTAMGLMLQDIKTDLSLSDTKLGFLTGIAFAAFYAGMGIPIARWADRGNRVTIISVTAFLWSVAVALCGAANSFAQMLLVRIGVAVGEAGCHPPAFSIIADYFDRAERPRAIARYMLGFSIALIVGYFVAGRLIDSYGWRMTFVIIGAPGILLAVLAWLTLDEPRKVMGNVQLPQRNPGFREVFLTLWRIPAFRHLLACFSLSYFFTNGIQQWQPAFFIRSHDLGTAELGAWLAASYGLSSLLGTFLGGELAARFASNNERLQFRAAGILYIVLAVLMAGVYLIPDHPPAFAVLSLFFLGGSAVNGPLFAATQTLVPPQMRAMSIAIILFFSNLIGLGLGPLAVGALSDQLQPWFGEESLRYALLAFSPGYVWCAWHLWKASRTVMRDLAAA